MPDYNDLVVHGLTFRTAPKGFVRGVLLKSFPFLTGGRKAFRVTVTVDDEQQWGQAQLDLLAYVRTPSNVWQPIEVNRLNHGWPAKFLITTNWIYLTGPYVLGLALFKGSARLPPHDAFEILLNFDIASSYAFRLTVTGIFIAAVLAFASAFGGAWLGSRLIQSDDPVEVVIVEPAPASQSETDSNEQ